MKSLPFIKAYGYSKVLFTLHVVLSHSFSLKQVFWKNSVFVYYLNANAKVLKLSSCISYMLNFLSHFHFQFHLRLIQFLTFWLFHSFFQIFTWNVLKNSRPLWRQDFHKIIFIFRKTVFISWEKKSQSNYQNKEPPENTWNHLETSWNHLKLFMR